MLKIYRSLKEMSQDNKNVSCFNCYVQDANVRVQLFLNCLKITDLTNALKRGKECRQTVITYTDIIKTENFFTELNSEYLIPNKKNLKNLIEDIQNLHIKNLQNTGFQIVLKDLKANTVFSPFAKIKPINFPKNNKWTKLHVVKAILSGQIFKGLVNNRFTEDKDKDIFNKREQLNLIEVAENLINESYKIYVEDSLNTPEDTRIYLSVGYSSKGTLHFNIDSRKNTIEYTKVTTKHVENKTEKTQKQETNSKVVNLFAYKKQKQNKQQELFNKLLSCNSLEQFKHLTEQYLKDAKQQYIITNSNFSPQMMDKLESLCQGDLVQMINCFDIIKYFKRPEELKIRNIK